MTDRPAVLIHSDNDELLMTLVSALDTDYQVDVVGERDCLSLVATEHPDFLLVDDMVNAPNCYEICQDVKRSALLSGTTVLLVSDLEAAELEEEIQLIGADDYVTSPVDADMLREKLATLQAFSLQQCS